MKRVISFSSILSLALSAISAQVVFEGRLTDPETGAPRRNESFMATPKFFTSENGVESVGTLAPVNVKTDKSGYFSFYSGEWDYSNGMDNLWLGVVIGNQEIVPRKRIVSAPYAIHARKADTLHENGTLRFQTLHLGGTAVSMIDKLEINPAMNETAVIWGTNNVIAANHIKGFDSISIPGIPLSSSRYYSSGSIDEQPGSNATLLSRLTPNKFKWWGKRAEIICQNDELAIVRFEDENKHDYSKSIRIIVTIGAHDFENSRRLQDVFDKTLTIEQLNGMVMSLPIASGCSLGITVEPFIENLNVYWGVYRF